MKCKVKVLVPRLMSGQKVNQEIIMFVEEADIFNNNRINLFGGQYEILEKEVNKNERNKKN